MNVLISYWHTYVVYFAYVNSRFVKVGFIFFALSRYKLGIHYKLLYTPHTPLYTVSIHHIYEPYQYRWLL